MKKVYLVNSCVAVLALVALFSMIKIDNDSRLPQNSATDYFMNSLPWIYLMIAALIFLIGSNLVYFFKKKR